MKINIIIQARMGSTRLPGKVLRPTAGRPMLSYQIERLHQVKAPHSLIIATSDQSADDTIEAFCQQEKVICFRGEEDNVLDRYYQACQTYPADIIVRLTADCPLIDPAVIDEAISLYKKQPADYISNTLERTYPRGMDVELFTYKALLKAFHEAKKPFDKEHVTPYIYRKSSGFTVKNYGMTPDASMYRLTVDTIEDFTLIKTLIEDLYPKNKQFTLADILKDLQEHPEWTSINQHIKQKET
jgi:spore coat polysaccharide biosynthesis protein SpsF